MAKTQRGKKIVTVKPHRRDGKSVPGHRRSTPNTSKGPRKKR